MLSVIVVAYNQEHAIARCLQSVQWADEIIVVDSMSTDRTIEIAKKFTNHIVNCPDAGYTTKCREGFSAANGDWLFNMDANEEISDDLCNEVLAVIGSPVAKDGYHVPLKTIVLGKLMQPEDALSNSSLRLFRSGRYVVEQTREGSVFKTTGDFGRLNGFILCHPCDSIEQYFLIMNDLTSLRVACEKRVNSKMQTGWLRLLFCAPVEFVRMFIGRKGYRNGFHGFLWAALQSIDALAVNAKRWEHGWRQKKGRGSMPPMSLEDLQRVDRLA